jgi:hypothetical protein
MKQIISFSISSMVAAASLHACDLCGCYVPQTKVLPVEEPSREKWWQGFYGAVSEQFTHFGTIQVDGREVENPAAQRLDSSVTQFVGGVSLHERFALQVNVPVIDREFKRPEGFATDRGSIRGLGDVSLLGKLVLFHTETELTREDSGKSLPGRPREPDFTSSAVFLGGVKFPTGDSSRLKEEFHEVEIEGAPESGIHGHDLALGTGSYDGIFGAQFSSRYRRLFFEANALFTWRGDGRHSYHFANDFAWSGGPGYFVLRRQNSTVGAQFTVSGEHKDTDRFQGRRAADTGITSVYLGPRLTGSYGKIGGELAAEFPIHIENTALQIVPDYRVRMAISFSF